VFGEFGQPGFDDVEPGGDVVAQPVADLGQFAAIGCTPEQFGAEAEFE